MTANQIAFAQHVENQRANRAREGIQSDTLAETKRANLEKEKLGQQQFGETVTHNRNTEAETARNNRAIVGATNVKTYMEDRQKQEQLRQSSEKLASESRLNQAKTMLTRAQEKTEDALRNAKLLNSWAQTAESLNAAQLYYPKLLSDTLGNFSRLKFTGGKSR